MKHEDEIMETKLEHDGGTGKGHSGNKGHILCHSDGEGRSNVKKAIDANKCLYFVKDVRTKFRFDDDDDDDEDNSDDDVIN